MADQYAVVSASLINDEFFRSAYAFLLSTLSRTNLKSIAAFVTTFAPEPDATRLHALIMAWGDAGDVGLIAGGALSRSVQALLCRSWSGLKETWAAYGMFWRWLPLWLFKGVTH